ncbi:hypothetical protein B0H19DRAFT_1060437 [Mycena capillaripes]|nr:hypothetical protein B0H19DRAFT_1060437 [Mycena capillaripes]
MVVSIAYPKDKEDSCGATVVLPTTVETVKVCMKAPHLSLAAGVSRKSISSVMKGKFCKISTIIPAAGQPLKESLLRGHDERKSSRKSEEHQVRPRFIVEGDNDTRLDDVRSESQYAPMHFPWSVEGIAGERWEQIDGRRRLEAIDVIHCCLALALIPLNPYSAEQGDAIAEARQERDEM